MSIFEYFNTFLASAFDKKTLPKAIFLKNLIILICECFDFLVENKFLGKADDGQG